MAITAVLGEIWRYFAWYHFFFRFEMVPFPKFDPGKSQKEKILTGKPKKESNRMKNLQIFKNKYHFQKRKEKKGTTRSRKWYHPKYISREQSLPYTLWNYIYNTLTCTASPEHEPRPMWEPRLKNKNFTRWKRSLRWERGPALRTEA